MQWLLARGYFNRGALKSAATCFSIPKWFLKEFTRILTLLITFMLFVEIKIEFNAKKENSIHQTPPLLTYYYSPYTVREMPSLCLLIVSFPLMYETCGSNQQSFYHLFSNIDLSVLHRQSLCLFTQNMLVGPNIVTLSIKINYKEKSPHKKQACLLQNKKNSALWNNDDIWLVMICMFYD